MYSSTALFILIGAVIAVAIGVYLIQRRFPHRHRRPHNDVTGAIFNAVAGFYAILVAFVIVSLWTNNSSAGQVTQSEANDLAGVYWLSRQMPLAQGVPLEHLTLNYAHTVINQEWPLLAEHESSPAATNLVYQMRDEAFDMNPTTLRDQVIFQQVTASVTALAADRRARLSITTDSGIPPFLWSGLIGGGVIIVGFAFLFGVSSTRIHVIMAVSLAAVVTTSLILIKDLNYPFSGPGQVGPQAFDVFLSRLPPPR